MRGHAARTVGWRHQGPTSHVGMRENARRSTALPIHFNLYNAADRIPPRVVQFLGNKFVLAIDILTRE
jgi:hypothetical protein